tara:strand:+ start:875 stop:1063 length:189 start_codon:yes stop_codon:yes gene_type:complete
MTHPICTDGLRRLINLELSRLVPGSPEEAKRAMRGRVGVYDQESVVIDAGINSYFATRDTAN